MKKKKKKEIDLTARKTNRSKNRVLLPRITPVGWAQIATSPSNSPGKKSVKL